jgi:hypothetical protein
MINVAIIEDNRLVRDGLTLKLNEEVDRHRRVRMPSRCA